MAKNLEANLIEVNGKFINFDQHREEYTQHYDALRKELYTQLRSNKVLDKLLKGHTLGGTYAFDSCNTSSIWNNLQNQTLVLF